MNLTAAVGVCAVSRPADTRGENGLACFLVGLAIILALGTAIVQLAVAGRLGPLLRRFFGLPLRLPYSRRGVLLTQGEMAFFHVLRQAAGPEPLIFAQVRLADLVKVEPGRDNRTWVNKVTGKHVDFVLCDPDTSHVRLVIELDDKTHLAPRRQERDRFVNAVLDAAAIPLLRIPAQRQYDPATLRRAILARLATPVGAASSSP